MEAYEVFTATQDDLFELLRLAKIFKEEASHFDRISFEAEKVATDFLYFINSDKANCWIVQDIRTGEMIGFVNAHVFSIPGTKAKIAEDCGLYLEARYRGYGISKKMIDAYVDWARTKVEADKYITIRVDAGVDNDQAVAAIKALGFTETGTILSYTGE